MKKFYVYTIKNEDPNKRSCVYVDKDHIGEFAQYQFQPSTMVYSGVIVEANDPQEAHEAYNTFIGENEIVWTDEPEQTVRKRKTFEAKTELSKAKLSNFAEALSKAEEAASKLALRTLAAKISTELLSINERLSYMARLVRKTSKENPEVTIEELYERLKKRYIDQLANLQYEDKQQPPGF
jgi:DNA repair exonuclease SbcCD nuclease subunit